MFYVIFNQHMYCLGKSTGIVSNTRVSHATPAALYAYAASRYWEDDAKVPPSARKSCKDISRQLVEDEPGKNINVSITDFVNYRPSHASTRFFGLNYKSM